MDERLVDASLEPGLGPRRYKFTRREGRNRRTRLLESARELLRERAPEDVSFADVCERAGIPRPSAYHFFPNVQAIFLGLRLLHGEELIRAALTLNAESFDSWRAYLSRLVDAGVATTQGEPAFARLVYGYTVSDPELRKVGAELDARLARLTLAGLEDRFVLPAWEGRDAVFAIAFSIVDVILRLAYRQRASLEDFYVDEAKRACISYLRNYLPEVCPARDASATGDPLK
jgi:AcrR family transcriptional regulator